MSAALRLFFARLMAIYTRTRGARGLLTAGTTTGAAPLRLGRIATRTIIRPAAAAATSRISIGRIFSALAGGAAIIDVASMVWELFTGEDDMPPTVAEQLSAAGLDPEASVSSLDDAGVAALLRAMSLGSDDPGVGRMLRDLAQNPDRAVEDIVRETQAVAEAYAVEDAYRDLAEKLNMRPSEVDRVVDAVEAILSAEPEDRLMAKNRIANGRL